MKAKIEYQQQKLIEKKVLDLFSNFYFIFKKIFHLYLNIYEKKSFELCACRKRAIAILFLVLYEKKGKNMKF